MHDFMEKSENGIFIKTLEMKLLILGAISLSSFTGLCQNVEVIENVAVMSTSVPADSISCNRLIIRGSDTTLVVDPISGMRNWQKPGDTTTVINPETGDSTMYIYFEQMPQAGYNLQEYLSNQTRCPISKFNSQNTKRVNVQFLVKADGSIINAKVLSHLNPVLDSVAKQIIATMPKWKAGRQNGKAVDVYYVQSVYFNADKPTR
jgi:hypothetical protein